MEEGGGDVLGKNPVFLMRARGCQLIEFCDFRPKSEVTPLLNNYFQESNPPEIK